MIAKQDMIHLPDVTLEELKESVTNAVEEMNIQKIVLSRNHNYTEFLLTFPEGIGNEAFIFLYCGLMSGNPVASRKLLGWFTGSDDMTEQDALEGEFRDSDYTTDLNKRIMISPICEDNDDMPQHAVIEDGREIHFMPTGCFKIIENGTLEYSEPHFDPDDFKPAFVADKKIVEEKNKGFFAALKNLFG